MQVIAYLDFNGPDNISNDAKNAVVTCSLVAAAAAGIVGIATDGAAAAATAQPAFIACMKAKGVEELDKYSVAFRTASGWTDYS